MLLLFVARCSSSLGLALPKVGVVAEHLAEHALTKRGFLLQKCPKMRKKQNIVSEMTFFRLRSAYSRNSASRTMFVRSCKYRK